jgi:hypothetical protein
MAATDLITLVEAKRELSALDQPVDDTLLGAYITAVSNMIDEQYGPVVYRTISNEQHETRGVLDIWLRVPPVASITSVTEYDVTGAAYTITPDTLTTKNVAGCFLNTSEFGAAKLQRRSGGSPIWWPIMGAVSVTYVAGRYATTAAVSEFWKQACRLTVSTTWQIQQGSGSITFGGVDAGYAAPIPITMPRAVQAMLATQKRIPGIA